MINWIQDGMIILKMALIRQLLWKPLMRKTVDPQKVQNELLLRILKRNRNTAFGREHGFEKISSYEAYKEAVSVNDYETLRTYIEKQEIEKKPYLNLDNPLMYAQTSGTTGKPKYIPILKRTIKQYRRSQQIVAYANYAAIPGVFKGKVLAIVSPAMEGHLDTGIPYGSMSGLIYQSMPVCVQAKYVVPPKVFEIANYQWKYYQIILHGLSEKNITSIATANPSTLIKLDQVMNEYSEQLIDDIKQKKPVRADEIRQLLLSNGSLTFADIWPNLKSVIIWGRGSCGLLIPTIKKKLPSHTYIVEMGYLSSEFRGGITVDVLNNREILTLHENFFEFVEKNDWGNTSPHFLTMDQIKNGKQYYIFATTQSGLYRYNINDIIEVTGHFNNTPTIRFVQKGKGVTNLTGEKLYEDQLAQAMLKEAKIQGVDFNFFIMTGDPKSLEYCLYIEHEPLELSNIEQHISVLNIEFNAKRKSGRLKPVRIVFVQDGTGDAYKQYLLRNGQREGQFKLIHLQYNHDCPFNFIEFERERLDAAA